ncbi:MAG: hypothetical protein P4M15_05595 [Alphaproteobacteria bacterium]|nr:hypothetical protein [Alphaproteobacteria bacterium]
MFDVPLFGLLDQTRKNFHSHAVCRNKLAALAFRFLTLQPNAFVVEIDMVDRKAQHFTLAKPHQHTEPDRVSQMIRGGSQNAFKVSRRNRARQRIRFPEFGNIRRSNQKRLSRNRVALFRDDVERLT